MKAQEFLQEWEKKNNPFYPEEMRWDRLKVNLFSKDFDDESNRLEKPVLPTLTGNLEEDLQIIYKNGKPHGIRDRSGYLIFFPNITSYTGQEKRYQEEIDQQNKLAEYLLHQLSKCSA